MGVWFSVPGIGASRPRSPVSLYFPKNFAVKSARTLLFNAVKTCLYCHRTKPLFDFAPHPKGRNGLHPWCDGCRLAYGKAKYRGQELPRAALTTKSLRPLCKEELMLVCEEFEDVCGPAQHLLRFGAAVSQATVEVNA